MCLCRPRASSGTEAVCPASTGSLTVACAAVGAPEPVLSPWDPGSSTACGVLSRGAGVGRGPPAWLALVVLHRCVRGCEHTHGPGDHAGRSWLRLLPASLPEEEALRLSSEWPCGAARLISTLHRRQFLHNSGGREEPEQPPPPTTLGPRERQAFLASKCLLRQALFRPFRGSVCFHKELFKPKHRCSFENEKSN